MLIPHAAVEPPLRHLVARSLKINVAELLIDIALCERWSR
jgi:hypothetical protein